MVLAHLRGRAALAAAGLAVSVVLPLTAAVGTASPAAAAPAGKKVSSTTKKASVKSRKAVRKKREIRKGKRIVKVARKLRGRPYVYGATGPRAFDCSGYTQTVVRRAIGKTLPRTSAMQRRSGKVDRVAKKNRRKGDLVFFHSGGGRVYHVGVYAGGGKMWHAPRPGKRTQRAPVYSNRVTYGRVV